jgi:glycosyltransferase involved in cell wall biosynthesis
MIGFAKSSINDGKHSQYFKKIFNSMLLNPKNIPFLTRFYEKIEDEESKVLLQIIDEKKDIDAWYCPTAFWGSFNQIKAPKLICVPDVVLTGFPVGFCNVGGDRFLQTFKNINRNIEQGQYFVTYSQDVKYNTLVEKYGIPPENIFSIAHGANCLDDLVVVDNQVQLLNKKNIKTKSLCENILSQEISKIGLHFTNKNLKFIFYASQFRPNKNIITLLKAYLHLLRQQFVQHKLILTGNINTLPEIKIFIEQHNLQNDVIFLHGISAQALASCYYLADITVNPSLSEGGFPFTFTESLSVDTPTLMANIGVTREILIDENVNRYMLFNPYDYLDLAYKMEWAIKNRDFLLSQQKPIFLELKKRTWQHVVNDYVTILDEISQVNY